MSGKALISPVTYDAANRWLKGRVNVLTDMSSGEIALSKNFQASVRAQSFFSAKVAETRVLDRLREVSDAYSSGTIDLASARTELKLFLEKEGHKPDDVSTESAANRSIQNLASTARLNLILTQNSLMAAAVGQREVSLDPDILERFPYFRYVSSVAKDKREEHRKFYNLVLPKKHPFWNTHTPPWDFECKCSLEDLTDEEAKETGIASGSLKGSDIWEIKKPSGAVLNVKAPESGFVFDIRSAFESCDMSRVKSIPMRLAVFNAMRDFSHANPATRFRCVTGLEALENPVIETAAPQALDKFIAEQMRNYRNSSSFNNAEIPLGSLSGKMRDALGISEKAQFFLSSGSSSYGLEHAVKKHSNEIDDGRFIRAMKDTVFAKKGVIVSVEFTGKKVYIGLDNPQTGAFSSFYKLGDDWNNWQLVSAHYPGEKYGEQRRKIH